MNTAGADASTLLSDLAWPDFYALLGVPVDASPEQLRTRMREAYMEATANADHRNVERRLHYQIMGQRIVPQARRILLDERTRRAYDRQWMLHRNDDPAAVPYANFVTQLAVYEAEEDARQLLDDSSKAKPPVSAPFVSSGLLSSVVPAQPAEKQADQTAGLSSSGVSSSTRLVSSGTTSAARDLFEQAHTVLRSEKKYAEMSSLPSFDSGNESRAEIYDSEKHGSAEVKPTPGHSATRQSFRTRRLSR